MPGIMDSYCSRMIMVIQVVVVFIMMNMTIMMMLMIKRMFAMVDDDDADWDYAKHELLAVGSRIILNLLDAHGFTPTRDLSWREYFKMQHNNFSMVFGHHPGCHIEKYSFHCLIFF